MSMSSPRLVRWAAEDGRVDDLIFHLAQLSDRAAVLKSVSEDHKRYPIHYAAARGHTRCVQILREAGKTIILWHAT